MRASYAPQPLSARRSTPARRRGAVCRPAPLSPTILASRWMQLEPPVNDEGHPGTTRRQQAGEPATSVVAVRSIRVRQAPVGRHSPRAHRRVRPPFGGEQHRWHASSVLAVSRPSPRWDSFAAAALRRRPTRFARASAAAKSGRDARRRARQRMKKPLRASIAGLECARVDRADALARGTAVGGRGAGGGERR